MLLRSASGVTLLGTILLVLTAGISMRLGLAHGEWRPLVDAAPLVLLGLALPLAWRYRRRHLAIASALLALLAQPGPWQQAFAGESQEGAVAWAWLIAAHLALLAFGRGGALVRVATLLHLAAIALSGAALHHLVPGLGRGGAADYLAFPGVPSVPFALGAALALGAMLISKRALAAALSITMLGLSLSAGGFLRPLDLPLLVAACQASLLLALLEESYRLAYHDALTGLPARRALFEAMEQLGGSYALAMVDIDRFKRFNDRHGHAVGDQVLRMVARELARVGSGGRAFRYGGEEFAIVFSGRSVQEAREALDTVRKTIAGRRFVIRSRTRPRRKPRRGAPRRVGSNTVRISVSGGVAGAHERGMLPREVLVAADKALYKAKRGGRNRVA